MSKIIYNDLYSYEIFEDGYDIYTNNSDIAFITQREPYGKMYDANGSYEENALLQIEELTAPATTILSGSDIIRADIDFMALMLDIDLPSYETLEEGI